MVTQSLKRQATPDLILRFAKLEAGGLWRRLCQSWGTGRPPALDFEDVCPPDSYAIVRAIELCRATSPEFLVNHGYRCYCFASAIANKYALTFDHEVVFIASILHDLGLTDHAKGLESFEIRGARAAKSHVLENGIEQTRAELIHEAIALHSSVGIADKGTNEVRLVHFGAGVDVIGFRSEEVSHNLRRAIVTQYPRVQFKQKFVALLEQEVADDQSCHIAGHMALGFAQKIKGAPFDE
ncbi:MAG: hypothetical protein GXP16_04225 [Gammaproteobacteria bacterium]|nr:hypothetical protein [Gammaproteobacteria bacterium]